MKYLISILTAVLVFGGLQLAVSAEEHGKPPVEELEQKLQNLIFQETVDGNELKNYDSLARLEEDLKAIMVWPLADQYLNEYFYEENGNVYLVPTEGPIQVQMDQNYSLEQISDTKYQLTQSSSNALWGDYTLEITYSYEAGRWVFAERNEIIGESGTGGELPDTASSIPGMLLFGLSLLGAGAVLMVTRRFNH